MCDVRHPNFIWPLGLERWLEPVFMNRVTMIRIGGRLVFANDPALQSLFPHNPGHRLLSDANPFLTKYLGDLWAAIEASRADEDLVDPPR
jgi:hypothetical protein